MTNEWANYHKQMKSYGWNGWGIYGLCPVSSFHFEFHAYPAFPYAQLNWR